MLYVLESVLSFLFASLCKQEWRVTSNYSIRLVGESTLFLAPKTTVKESQFCLIPTLKLVSVICIFVHHYSLVINFLNYDNAHFEKCINLL